MYFFFFLALKFKQFSNISADDLMKESTMRDVVARCEEGFSAQITTHQKQMDKMAQDVESMRDMVNVMESAHVKQTDALSKRDAQIEKLKQELSASKSLARVTKMPISKQTKTPRSSLHPTFIPTMESTKVPVSKVPELQEHVHIPPSSPKIELSKKPVLPDTKITQPTVTLQDFNPAISLAVKHISEAISTGLSHSSSPQQQDDELEYDMMTSCLEPPNQSIVDISNAISHVFKAVISSTVLNREQKVDDSKQTITQALKNAIQHSTVKNFTPIHEAVAFIQIAPLTEFVSPLVPVNEEPPIDKDLPELIVTEGELPALECEIEEETVKELSVQELPAFECSAAEKEFVALECTAEKKMTEEPPTLEEKKTEEELPTTEKKTVQELPTAEEETPITHEQELPCQNQICTEESNSFFEEAYSHSINQPSALSFIFNKWTVVCFAVYIFFQTD